MFKLLRRFTLGVLLALVVGATFLYLRNPVHRKLVVQATERVREQFQDKKRPTWKGTVVVVDALEGDTVLVNTEANPNVVARLAAIDAPEMPDKFKRNGQPLAEESREFLARLVKDKAVEMQVVATDASKIPLILLPVGGIQVNAEMARAGLAEAGAEGSDELPVKYRHMIENAEFAARQQRTNIWGLANYVRPVEHRIRYPDTAGVPAHR